MKDYIVVCHGCGNIRVHQAMFMSSPSALSHVIGNLTFVIPAWGCKDCIASGAIKRAFDSGPTPEALANFRSQVPAWADRIRNR